MITFTKEQLIASAHARIEFAEMMLAGELEPLKERTWSIELELARIALASLEAEVVAIVEPSDYVTAAQLVGEGPARKAVHELFEGALRIGDKLFTAPPATVSVPDDVTGPLEYAYKELTTVFMRNHISAFERYGIYPDGSAGIQAMRIALDGMERRAAMLQGAEQPQNQQQNIPNNIPANTPCKEAPEHIWLQTAGVWPENGEFSELTWCSDNQHKDDTLYVRADVVTGNSPVIPDWQTQAEKMAELYGSSFVLFRNGESPQCADPSKVIISFTDEGLGHGAAAPQQEAK